MAYLFLLATAGHHLVTMIKQQLGLHHASDQAIQYQSDSDLSHPHLTLELVRFAHHLQAPHPQEFDALLPLVLGLIRFHCLHHLAVYS